MIVRTAIAKNITRGQRRSIINVFVAEWTVPVARLVEWYALRMGRQHTWRGDSRTEWRSGERTSRGPRGIPPFQELDEKYS